MEQAAFWIVGGPNGAGKTTLASHPRFQRLLHGLDPEAIPEITGILAGAAGS